MHPTLYPVPKHYKSFALLDGVRYQRLQQQANTDPDAFWEEQGRRLQWVQPYTQIQDVSFDPADVHIRWFYDGTLNVSVNCLDRHLAAHGDEIAIIWEPDDETAPCRKITYRELHLAVCQFANGLRQLGVKKSDVVTIYLPMVPEAVIAMLACARIGAIHSVVFAGFSPKSLVERINDGHSRVVITADEGYRGGKVIPLKKNVDAALSLESHPVEHVIVLQNTGEKIAWVASRDRWYHELTLQQPTQSVPEIMNAEDPLFILYTSGSTGKPKGVLHSSGGYLVYASLTHEWVFDYHVGEIFWCTADVGWITGHSYSVYGPLANGATVLLHEGTPQYPDSGRLARIIDKHQVNILYTAPTALRALMAVGDSVTHNTSLKSLRLLGSVGEPINPEAWYWYYETFGHGQCPIVDTWWQTETGGILITPLPGIHTLKPGAAMQPFLSIRAGLVDDEGHLLEGPAQGNLVLLNSWPGQMRTIFGDHQRFIDMYFSIYPGMYYTGDGSIRDEDGDYRITGRVDDVINVSGHRLGTAEIESALVAHAAVAEAAVVGYPHPIKGQGIFAYVTLMHDIEPNIKLEKELIQWVQQAIGPIAAPDQIQWAAALPKTRSGKIMRRLLRKMAAGDIEQLGDLSTLADIAVIEQLMKDMGLQR